MTTKEAILAQIYAAFGQGTGSVRVPREAMKALDGFYGPKITDIVEKGWEEGGTHALERIRAVGRMAMNLMAAEGRTEISATDVTKSAELVSLTSPTDWC